jgi:hypothetical protein
MMFSEAMMDDTETLGYWEHVPHTATGGAYDWHRGYATVSSAQVHGANGIRLDGAGRFYRFGTEFEVAATPSGGWYTPGYWWPKPE